MPRASPRTLARKDHRLVRNKANQILPPGAFVLSYIEVDVSDLRNEFPLEPKATTGPRTRVSNRDNRVVKFDLVIMVEGRQLKYEARWPSAALSADEVRVRKRGYVSLAPSFVPGTD
jgi:hypothetical protein